MEWRSTRPRSLPSMSPFEEGGPDGVVIRRGVAFPSWPSAIARVGSAPGPTPALPRPGETLGHELVAEGPALAGQDAKRPAVAVGVARGRPHLERPGVHEFGEPPRRPGTQVGFAPTAGRMGLGRVDVGDTHLHAADPGCVAIDDAVCATARVADGEGCSARGSRRGRPLQRKRQPDQRTDGRDDGEGEEGLGSDHGGRSAAGQVDA